MKHIQSLTASRDFSQKDIDEIKESQKRHGDETKAFERQLLDLESKPAQFLSAWIKCKKGKIL